VGSKKIRVDFFSRVEKKTTLALFPRGYSSEVAESLAFNFIFPSTSLGFPAQTAEFEPCLGPHAPTISFKRSLKSCQLVLRIWSWCFFDWTISSFRAADQSVRLTAEKIPDSFWQRPPWRTIRAD